MRKYIITILSALAITFGTAEGYAAIRSWESVKSEQGVALAKIVAKNTDIEVRAGKGVIYVTTTRPINIKVFTILGQPIAQDHLPQGTSQLILGTHGVFIVKAGDATFKVAV